MNFRKARADEAQRIHEILLEAFAPYRYQYTPEAYYATVLSPQKITTRIHSPDMQVFVVVDVNKIVGTLSVRKEGKQLHFQSMTVDPSYQRRGVGRYILEEIEQYAKGTNCRTLLLETYAPLKKAIYLYEKFGFQRTGKERTYHDIVIFEMTKNIF